MTDERFDVTLALVGDPRHPFEPFSDQERERPWDERIKIRLSVERAETLAAVIERALEGFGIRAPEDAISPHHHVDLAFFTENHPRGYWQRGVILVDDAGRAIWGVHDMRLVTYGEVLASADAGALAGDPLRVHIILREGIGNGIGLDWPALFQGLQIAWQVAWEVAERVAVIGGVAAAVKLVRDRLGKGREAVARNAPQWDRRGAAPHAFSLFLAIHPWDIAHLAKLLDCSPADARAVLEVFGYARGGDGLWHPANDEAAQMLSSVFEEAEWHMPYPSKEQQQRFRERIGVLLETGRRPPDPEPDDYLGEWDDFERAERRRVGLLAGGLAAVSFAAGWLFRRR